MKPIYIYINSPEKSHKLLYLIGFILLTVIVLAFTAPTFIKSYINKQGADKKGYAFRIGDLDFNLLKSQMLMKDIIVFNVKSSVKFAEVSSMLVDFKWNELIRNEKKFDVQMETVNFILSKDLVDEVRRIKTEAEDKIQAEFYIDEVTAKINKLNVRNLKADDTKTILSLSETEALVSDFGFGSINEKTEFKVNSKITEGGVINLKGQTRLEDKATPWKISGEMKGITAAVIEKMAGDKLPIEIKQANINTKINAHSSNGQIEGVIEPDVKDFKLSEEKEEGFVKRNIAKVANKFLKGATEGEEEIKMEIPFTLNQNLTLNFEDTINKLRGKK